MYHILKKIRLVLGSFFEMANLGSARWPKSSARQKVGSDTSLLAMQALKPKAMMVII